QLIDEVLGGLGRALGPELEDRDEVDAGLLDELQPALEADEGGRARLRVQLGERIAVERHGDGVDAELAGTRDGLAEHGTVAEVDAVELADRDDARVAEA